MNTYYNVTLVDADLKEVTNFSLPANPRFLATCGEALMVTDQLPEGDIKAAMLEDARKMDENFGLDGDVRVFARLGSAVYVSLPDGTAQMACSMFVEMAA